jgi:hypothetical protein
MAQTQKTSFTYSLIIHLLRIRPLHTYEFRSLGVANPAPRIRELIDKGYVIHRRRIEIVEANGIKRRNVTLYSLLAEPAKRRKHTATK